MKNKTTRRKECNASDGGSGQNNVSTTGAGLILVLPAILRPASKTSNGQDLQDGQD
jgi:hypothetical protein